MSRIPTHSLSLGAQGSEPKGHRATPKWTEFAPVRRGAVRRHTYRPGGDEKGTDCPKRMDSTRGGVSGFLTRRRRIANHPSSAVGMACLASLTGYTGRLSSVESEGRNCEMFGSYAISVMNSRRSQGVATVYYRFASIFSSKLGKLGREFRDDRYVVRISYRSGSKVQEKRIIFRLIRCLGHY